MQKSVVIALAGQTVELSVGESLVIAESDGLTAELSDAAVAAFTPARTEAGTSYNAGVEGLAPGTCAVRLSDGTSFSVTVS